MHGRHATITTGDSHHFVFVDKLILFLVIVVNVARYGLCGIPTSGRVVPARKSVHLLLILEKLELVIRVVHRLCVQVSLILRLDLQ